MIKRVGKCGIGFYGAEYEETFYFEDGTTEEQMQDDLYEWAEQFLEAWFEDGEEHGHGTE